MPFSADQMRRFLEQYNPCDDGLHVCAFREDTEFGPHVTEANFPGVRRDTFDALKAEFDDADLDLLIDLMEDGSIVDDFGIKRQMLDPMRRKLEALTSC